MTTTDKKPTEQQPTEQQPTEQQPTEQQPTELRARSPWADLAAWPDIAPWSGWMTDLMRDMWPGTLVSGDFRPGGELRETDGELVLELDVPGIDRKDITVEASGRRLGVRGTKKVREGHGMLHHTTRTAGSFSYEALLPVDIDEAHVTAKLADGVLTVTMPKATRSTPTTVQIS